MNRRITAPSWVHDPATFRHTDAAGITLAVSTPTLDGTASVAIELPGGLGAGGVWVDDVPAALLASALLATPLEVTP